MADRKEKTEEKPDRELVPDFFNETQFISTIVDILILFLAVFVAIARSREKLFHYAKLLSHQQKQYSKLLNKKIDSILTQIRALSASDRVILGQFHDQDFSNFEAFSASNEITNIGVESILKQIQDIPKKKLADEIELLESAKDKTIFADIYTGEVKTDKISSPLKQKCREHLIKIGVCCSYEILIGEVGILAIQYLSKDEARLKILETNKQSILRLRDYLKIILSR
ncbi:MAG: hypothetical protein GVY04_11955 [Cyanobacteria bacterium]|jgi:hypothetical protein|nr:hypothetical protein [Cyanobacteria bacterium GSL.Bin1]